MFLESVSRKMTLEQGSTLSLFKTQQSSKEMVTLISFPGDDGVKYQRERKIASCVIPFPTPSSLLCLSLRFLSLGSLSKTLAHTLSELR